MRAGIDTKDGNAVEAHLNSGAVRVGVQYTNGAQQTMLNGEDVSALIRSQEAGQAASDVSQYRDVRKAMVALQQDFAKGQSVLLDGRDIGTVVLPDADVKIYLTASDVIRAERRMKQMEKSGTFKPFEEVLSEVRQRDEQDQNRKIDPLRKADDAVVVDSSFLTIDETVEAILAIVKEKTGVSYAE